MSEPRKSLYSIGKTGNLDFKLLHVFLTVADSGGLTQAQEPLNIGLSAISTCLSDLEKRLGLTLCHRGRGGFVLTDQGREV